MNILCLILILQTGPTAEEPVAPIGSVVQEQAFRNPFRRFRPTPTPSPVTESATGAETVVQEATPANRIQAPSPSIEFQTSVQRVLPPILNDLRAIVILHEGTGYALFGDRIVSLSDTIEGFTVTGISFDEVILSDQWDTVERRLGNPLIRSATRER